MSKTYDEQNPNSNLDPQNANHKLAHIGSEEYYDEKPAFSAAMLDPYQNSEAYDGFGGCWPGDGSGMDDLADFNAMEGYDM